VEITLLAHAMCAIIASHNIQQSTNGDGYMQSIKAIYDGVNFTPRQPVPFRGRCEVIITFLEQNEVANPLLHQPASEPDFIEKLCGSLANYPEMAVDKFLERKRADRELER